MSDSGLTEELERFIAIELHSVEQLEILLLLSGNPHRVWTSRSVYDVVKSSPSSVEQRLQELVERKFLSKEAGPEPRYQFAPSNEQLWKIINELRDAYKERPVKIVQAIYTKTPDSIQEFSRAFRLRKDK